MKPNALMNVSSGMQKFTEVVLMVVDFSFWEIKINSRKMIAAQEFPLITLCLCAIAND